MRVVCIDNKELEEILTLGKIYEVVEEYTNDQGYEFYHVKDDNKVTTSCFKIRFKTPLEYKLKRILK